MASAIIKSGGKQYRIAEGDLIRIEKIEGNPGDTVEFPEVLMVGDAASGVDPKVGRPFVAGAKAVGEIVKQGRAPKVIIFKFRRRKRSKKKAGHRQSYTAVKITGISG